MKNLFIVNTPFHLLTSFILSRSFFRNDDNYLALIHPHGYEKWAKNDIMAYIPSEKSGYKEVFPLINFLSKNSASKFPKFSPYIKHIIWKYKLNLSAS